MIQFSSGGSQFYAGARCGCRQAAVAGRPAPSPMGPAPCDAPCRSPEAWARAAPGLVVPPLVSANAPRPPCHIVRGRACRGVGPTPRPVLRAGKGLDNTNYRAAISGAVSGAYHVRAMAEQYGVPVILHTDHCAKKLCAERR